MVMGVGVLDKDEGSMDGHYLHARYKELGGLRSVYKKMSSDDMVNIWTETVRTGVTHFLHKRSPVASSSDGAMPDTDPEGHLWPLLCIKQDVSALSTAGMGQMDKKFDNPKFEASYFSYLEGADTDSEVEY